jgi:thiol-disulfide isomerase/thioredoxin
MKKTVFLSLFCLLFGLTAQAQIITVIQGEVIDRPQSKQLLLLRQGEDPRIKGVYIPITEGKFEHTLAAPVEEVYEVIFEDEHRQGPWRPITFFAENDTVRLTLYPMDRYEENVIDGGPLNRQYLAFLEQGKQTFDPTPLYDEMEELDTSGRMYNERAKELLAALDAAGEDRAAWDKAINAWNKLQDADEHYSPEAAAVNQKIKQFHQQVREWEIDYARRNVSIPGYFVLIEKLKPLHSRMGLDNTSAYELYNTVYANAYPDHPYTQELQTMILSASHIKPGGKYLDFTAPDFEGKAVTLSEQIDGKIALVDLWASWCGPCRRLSMSMIPVYEKFKDKGFTIVGVAREEKAEYGIAAARQDGYPWLNLLEVKDTAGIWNLYGVGNAGGATFLVDRDGTILAVSPEAEEVESILGEKLRAQ